MGPYFFTFTDEEAATVLDALIRASTAARSMARERNMDEKHKAQYVRKAAKYEALSLRITSIINEQEHQK